MSVTTYESIEGQVRRVAEGLAPLVARWPKPHRGKYRTLPLTHWDCGLFLGYTICIEERRFFGLIVDHVRLIDIDFSEAFADHAAKIGVHLTENGLRLVEPEQLELLLAEAGVGTPITLKY